MSNSSTHFGRIDKIRTGLLTALVSGDKIRSVLGIFDTISAAEARSVAARTEFSVGTFEKLRNAGTSANPNPEGRRQMARTIYFLDDLKQLRAGQSLSRPRSDSEFGDLWKQHIETLASRVNAGVAALAPAPPSVVMPPPAVHEDKLILGPPIVMLPPRKFVMSPQMEATFATLGQMAGQHRVNIASGGSESAANTAWGHAVSGILVEFSSQINRKLDSVTSLQDATQGAYTEFESAFSAIAAEIKGHLSLAKSLFEMLESAPFPISVAGQIGTKIVAQFHVDSELPRTRPIGAPVYFENNVPLLVRVKSKLQTIKDWKEDVTRLGVPAASLPSRTSLVDIMSTAKSQSLQLLETVFKSAMAESFGSTPQEKMSKATAFHDSVLTKHRQLPAPLRGQLVVTEITKLEAETKRAIIEIVGPGSYISSGDIQPFIELQLFADYLAKAYPARGLPRFSTAIDEAIITRLENAPISLITRKTGSNQTATIFASGKLPFASGHPNHVGAIVYFFRWYRTNINPFMLARGVQPQALRDSMTAYIRLLGENMKRFENKHRIGHSTTDWGKVNTAMSTAGGAGSA